MNPYTGKSEENAAAEATRELSFERRFMRVSKMFLVEDTYQEILRLTALEKEE